MPGPRLALLFQRYLDKTATDAERTEFFELIRRPGSDEILRSLSEHYRINEDLLIRLPEETSRQILAAVLTSDKPAPAPVRPFRSVLRPWMRYAAAILFLIVVAAGVSYIISGKNDAGKVTLAGNQVIRDVLPGHSGAVLKLSNGRSILLDTVKNGRLAEGFVKSSDAITIEKVSVEYATLFTPFGRQEQIILSDGTKVWLNAGSSLRFPTAFAGTQRRVEVTGEAYFEVARNAAQPFIVKAGSEEIKVLGTHFNVNAYADELSVKTTLLEGSVEINNNTILRPDEQCENGTVSKVDADASVAWVYGFFQFEHADIKAVMRQLSRWYNVEVQYEGKITEERFGGEIQRNLKLSEVLELLSRTGIHYILNGSMLTIRS